MAVTAPTMGTTTYSSFWEKTGDLTQYAPLSRSQEGWRSPLERRIARLFDKQQMREIKALMGGLIGATTGSNVTANAYRIQPTLNAGTTGAATPTTTNVGDLGGAISVETQNIINRNTTAADVTYLKYFTSANSMTGRSLTYADDLSGNGSNFGGKSSEVGW